MPTLRELAVHDPVAFNRSHPLEAQAAWEAAERSFGKFRPWLRGDDSVTRALVENWPVFVGIALAAEKENGDG